MTELHCVNTHTAQADGAVAAALPPPAVELDHPHSPPTLSAPLCSLLYHSPAPGNCFLQARPESELHSLFWICSRDGKRCSLVPDVSRASRMPALQVRVESGMWCASYCTNPSAASSFEDEQKKRVGIKISAACSPNIPLCLTYKVFIWFSSCWGYWNPTGIYIISTSAATLQSNNLLYSFYTSQPSQYVPNAESLKNRGLVNKCYCLNKINCTTET